MVVSRRLPHKSQTTTESLKRHRSDRYCQVLFSQSGQVGKLLYLVKTQIDFSLSWKIWKTSPSKLYHPLTLFTSFSLTHFSILTLTQTFCTHGPRLATQRFPNRIIRDSPSLVYLVCSSFLYFSLSCLVPCCSPCDWPLCEMCLSYQVVLYHHLTSWSHRFKSSPSHIRLHWVSTRSRLHESRRRVVSVDGMFPFFGRQTRSMTTVERNKSHRIFPDYNEYLSTWVEYNNFLWWVEFEYNDSWCSNSTHERGQSTHETWVKLEYNLFFQSSLTLNIDKIPRNLCGPDLHTQIHACLATNLNKWETV
jgi:hypothetical protein